MEPIGKDDAERSRAGGGGRLRRAGPNEDAIDHANASAGGLNVRNGGSTIVYRSESVGGAIEEVGVDVAVLLTNTLLANDLGEGRRSRDVR